MSFRYHYPVANTDLPSGNILDDGCGQGDGTLLLNRLDRSIVAIDPDPKAILRARKRALATSIDFRVKTSLRLPFPDAFFDGAVSFEVIEHMDTDDQRIYVSELARVLKVGARLLLSTPNRKVIEPYYISGLSPINVTHIAELYPDDLRTLLSGWLEIDSVKTLHAVDLEQRKLSLEYQQKFPIPYRVRTMVPLFVRACWMKLRGSAPPERLVFDQVSWEELANGKSLRYEGIMVSGRRSPTLVNPESSTKHG